MKVLHSILAASRFCARRLAAVVALLTIPAAVFAAGSAPQPTICERACWGARAPQGSISQESALVRAIVHHTANQNDYNTQSLADSQANVRATQNYHMDVNGWSDIGYHFLCDKLGNTFEGRQGSMTSIPRGAHDGANTQSFGFNIMGYYHTPYNQTPTQASLDALAAVIAWRMPTGWAGPYGSPGGTYGSLGNAVGYVDSHRRVNATACPGDLIHNPYIGNNTAVGTLRDMIQAVINGVCTKTIPAAPNSASATAPTGTQVNVSWLDASSDEDGFRVSRSTTSGGPYTQVGQVGPGVQSFSDTTVAGGTTYYYVVRAYNCAGESGNSNEASVTTPATQDIIIDNTGATFSGTWSTGTSAGDKYGADYRYKAGVSGGPNYAQFTPTVPTAAQYDVFEWHPQGTNRTTNARISVTHSGGTANYQLNQQSNGGAWNLLGRHTFNAGSGGYVRITDGHSDTANVVMADAIKFAYVGPPPANTPVHVHSITMSWVAAGGKFKSRAVVNVKSNTGANVAGATVTGNFTGSINNSGLSGVTDANGNATITSSSSIKTGTVTFTVTNISGSNMTYDSGANVVTSATHSR